MTCRKRGSHRLRWVAATLSSALWIATAQAEPEVSRSVPDSGAVDRLVPPTTGEADSPSLYASWNAQLQTRPDPFHGQLLVLEAAPVAEHATPSALSPWLALAGGVVVGGFLVWLVMRRQKALAREVWIEGPARRAVNGGGDIELVSSQVLQDQGSVLVVNVCGERLVLGVSGTRDYVTLLTKLGAKEAAPNIDPETLGNMLRPANHPAPARKPAAAGAPLVAPNASGTSGEQPPPDEDLEELLDELLGKVRGLKPTPKQADET